MINKWCRANSKSNLCHPEGWYKTGPLWKAGHPPLPNNHKGSLSQLSNVVKRFQKVPSHLDEYPDRTVNRLKGAIVEKVNNETQGERECYLSHKGDIREAATE